MCIYKGCDQDLSFSPDPLLVKLVFFPVYPPRFSCRYAISLPRPPGHKLSLHINPTIPTYCLEISVILHNSNLPVQCMLFGSCFISIISFITSLCLLFDQCFLITRYPISFKLIRMFLIYISIYVFEYSIFILFCFLN